MKYLPASPDLSHLRKQAKRLLREAQAGDTPALQRFIEQLPAAHGFDIAAMSARELKLADAQSVVARDYGFKSWTELKRYVAWRRTDRAERIKTWLGWVYDGFARERGLAMRMIKEEPDLFAGEVALACAWGDEAAIAAAIARNADWARSPAGPFGMPPLVAVTHSKLILEEGFAAPLLACARLLLQHGADVNASWTDARWPAWPLSALFGAAGKTHNAEMTRLLLAAGACPDDNESLYHSVEGRDPTCTQLLLNAGARVVGTNAIGRVLDYDKLDLLKLLLGHGGDAKERPWIHHAILRGRSLEHVRALAEAGADLNAKNDQGMSLYRWAKAHGRVDVLELLREFGIEETSTDEEEFVAACARGDENAARAVQVRTVDIFSRLTEEQLQTLPRLAAVGDLRAVQTMLALGWPQEVKAGWDATALNHAIFQGDARMTQMLLDAGADWRTPHGFGDNALGTLSHASQAEDIGDPAPRDYVGCAHALIAHGVPPISVKKYAFSAEIADYFDTQT
jgi:ankyrin repeat protein